MHGIPMEYKKSILTASNSKANADNPELTEFALSSTVDPWEWAGLVLILNIVKHIVLKIKTESKQNN